MTGKYVFALMLFSTATGCGHAPLTSKDFTRGTVPEEQFERDAALCSMEGQKMQMMVGSGQNPNIPINAPVPLLAAQLVSSHTNSDSAQTTVYNRMYGACMRSKGYKKDGQ